MRPKLKIQQKTSVALTAAIAVSVAAVGFAAAAIVMNLASLKTAKTNPAPGSIATFNACLCGNGAVETGETCDDSNRVAGDGCGVNCTREPNNVMINGRQKWAPCANLSLNLRQSASIKIGSRSHSFTYVAATARDASDASGALVIDRSNRQPGIVGREFVVDGQRFTMLGVAPLILRLGNNRECVLVPCAMAIPRVLAIVPTEFDANTPQIVLSNMPEVTIGRYEFKTSADTNEAVSIKTLSVVVNTSSSLDGFNAKVFSQLKIYNGSALIGTVNNPADSSYYVINIPNLGLTVPANGGKATITVKGDARPVDGVNVKNGDGFAIRLETEDRSYPVTGEGQISHNAVEFINPEAADALGAPQFNIYSSYPTVKFSGNTPAGEFTPAVLTPIAKLDLSAGVGPDVAIKGLEFTIESNAPANSNCSTSRPWLLKNTDTGALIGGVGHNLVSGAVSINLTKPLIIAGAEFLPGGGSPAPITNIKRLTLYTNTTCLAYTGARFQVKLVNNPKTVKFGFVVPNNTVASTLSYDKGDVLFPSVLRGGALMYQAPAPTE